MTHQYLYLKLLLRNNLGIDLDQFALGDTDHCGLACNFMGLRLSSAFQPVFRTDGRTAGRKALLRASRPGHGDVTPEAAFAEALKANRLVEFDRLVRVVHLLNHARAFPEHELLFLNVHPQLLASVSNHGRAFEQILHYYSVPTSRVVIELQETEDRDTLFAAANNYRSLGYRIAVEAFGASSLEPVLELRPDIVKLDGVLIRAVADSDGGAESLRQLVARLRETGIQVVIKDIETPRQLEIARRSGADLLQGYQLAYPEFAPAARRSLCRDEQLAA